MVLTGLTRLDDFFGDLGDLPRPDALVEKPIDRDAFLKHGGASSGSAEPLGRPDRSVRAVSSIGADADRRLLGRVTVKVVPLPGVELKVTLPPCSSATFCTTSRPIPVPSVPLDEKKSSNTLSLRSLRDASAVVLDLESGVAVAVLAAAQVMVWRSLLSSGSKRQASMALATRLQSRLWRPSGSKVPTCGGSLEFGLEVDVFAGHAVGEEIPHLEHDVVGADAGLERRVRGPWRSRAGP